MRKTALILFAISLALYGCGGETEVTQEEEPMNEELTLTVEKAHKYFGIEFNNRSWDLLDKGAWSEDEGEELLHMAHASLLHWSKVGTPANVARGNHLLARVYAAFGNADEALQRAEICYEICEENGNGDWDLAFACEAMARAHALAGNSGEFEHWLQKAKDAGAAIAEEEDKKVFMGELLKVPGYH